MIIYGTKAHLLVTEGVAEQCAHCYSNNAIQMSVFQRYAHVFWIPFFPVNKTGVSQCIHCKQALRLKEMPAALRLSFDNLKLRTKTPYWTFSGLALIALFALIDLFTK
jgi:hypothetical protein